MIMDSNDYPEMPNKPDIQETVTKLLGFALLIWAFVLFGLMLVMPLQPLFFKVARFLSEKFLSTLDIVCAYSCGIFCSGPIGSLYNSQD